MTAFGPASGTLARLSWFANIKYIVGGLDYSSNDIEHGVLRGNKPSPAHPLSLLGLSQLAPPTFKSGDPRLPQVHSCTALPVRLLKLETFTVPPGRGHQTWCKSGKAFSLQTLCRVL